MSLPKIQITTACAIAATLLLSACGQAGPLYLPDQDSHKNKALRREQRAKATGNSATPANTVNGGATSSAPDSPAASAPTAPPPAAPTGGARAPPAPTPNQP